MPIQVVAILPDQLDSKILDRIIRQACLAEIREDVKILKEYTSGWKKEDQPKWSIRSKKTAQGYESRASTSSTPFVWVELGTRVRWRVMSPDFQPQTRPGTLKTRSRRGRALGFYNRPRPGIEPRNNLETLSKERAPIFTKKLQADLNMASKSVFK